MGKQSKSEKASNFTDSIYNEMRKIDPTLTTNDLYIRSKSIAVKMISDTINDEILELNGSQVNYLYELIDEINEL